MSANESRLETLLVAAVEIEDKGQRDAFVEAACAGDVAQLAELQSMVSDYFAAGSLIDRPAYGIATMIAPLPKSEHPLRDAPGHQIGPYKLRELLGEGGMGTVFIAEQEKPVRRKVALKLIKLGMDSREVLSRFEAERQVLALMDHPNIARVLDAGLSDSGRPYFVMEIVKGLPITDHCDVQKLGSRERLGLFIQLCRAIQHAHQKGIIHRDLKPSNVLVAMHDTIPVVKVIDFGVAKAIGQPLTENSLYTGLGQMVGTPLYMSPEQAGQSSVDVDTRSDVYSLGVLLYELLTGCTPFEKETLKQAGYEEMRRIIQEVDPPRPSTRFSTLNAAASSTIAMCRQSEPRKLSQQLRGELDWIVMKALEKDRTRRYESASAFAADVERHLRDEPVEAGPPSASYRFRKLFRRNQRVVLTAGAVTFALVAGTAFSVWQATEASVARGQAERGQNLAEAAGLEAKADRDRAREAERRTAEEAALVTAVNDFLLKDLIGLADSQAQANEGFSPSPDLTLRAALDRAATAVGERFKDRHRVEAVLRKTIGEAYRGVGEPQEAIIHLERAVSLYQAEFGPEHPETLDAINALAITYVSLGRADDAIPKLEAVSRQSESSRGPDHIKSLIFNFNLATAIFNSGREVEGLKLQEEMLARFTEVLGPDAPETLTCESNLAGAFDLAKRPLEAIPLLERVVEKRTTIDGIDAPDTLCARVNLAAAYGHVGRMSEAIRLNEDLHEILSATFGKDHPKTLTCMNNLASEYGAVGRSNDQIALCQEVLERRTARLGPDHIETLNGLNNLGVAYMRARRAIEAVPLYEEAYGKRKELLGPGHRETLNTLINLSTAYRALERTEDEVRILRAAFEAIKAVHGTSHPGARLVLRWLAEAHERCGRFAEVATVRKLILDECLTLPDASHSDRLDELNRLAEAYDQACFWDAAATVMEQLLEERQTRLVPDDTQTFTAMGRLGDYYRKAGRWADGELLYNDLSKRVVAKLGPEHRETLRIETSRAVLISGSARDHEAIPLLEQVSETQQTRFGPDDSDRLRTLQALGWAYHWDGRYKDADRLARDLIDRRRQESGTETISVAHGLSLLGMNLLAQEQFADAENVLQECLKASEKVKQPEWNRFRVMNLLGAALAGQGKQTEAEPLLVDGYQRMKAAEALIPAPWKRHFTVAGEHVVHFYESTGSPEKAALWREKLAVAAPPDE